MPGAGETPALPAKLPASDPIDDMIRGFGFEPYDPDFSLEDEELLGTSKAKKAKRDKYQFNCPPSLMGADGKHQREQLGMKICNMVFSNDASKNELMDSADQVDELYLGREVQSLTPLWDDAPTYNAQTLRNKVQDLVGYVTGPMVANDPFFIFRAGGPKGKPVDAVQTVIHFFLHRGRWHLALDETGNLTARRGRCPMRVTYIPSRPGRSGKTVKPRFMFEPIDTRFFTAYPNDAKNFEQMRAFGHLDQCRVQEIIEKQKAGHYFDDKQIRTGAEKHLTMGDQDGDKQQSTTDAILPEDHPVDRCSLLYRDDLDGDGYEELYHVVVAKQLRALLYCELHQLDQPNYADYFFELETGRYFPEASPGTCLVGPHHFVNDSLNMMTWLTTYVAVPPMFAENWSYSDEVIRSRPGEMTPVDSIGNMASGGGKIDLGMFPGLHELALRLADSVAGVSQTGSGSQFQAGTTATAANQAWAGQMNGITSHQRKFNFGAIDTAKIVLEYLYWNFDDWYPAYQDVLPPDLQREDFEQDYWIEVNGETANTTPGAVLQQITMFLQALMPILQAQPNLLQLYPDLIPGLVRAFLDSTSIPGKEAVLPTPEEEAATKQQMSMADTINATIQQHLAAAGGAPGQGQAGAPVQQPGVGVPRPPMGAGIGGPPGQAGAAISAGGGGVAP